MWQTTTPWIIFIRHKSNVCIQIDLTKLFSAKSLVLSSKNKLGFTRNMSLSLTTVALIHGISKHALLIHLFFCISPLRLQKFTECLCGMISWQGRHWISKLWYYLKCGSLQGWYESSRLFIIFCFCPV